jgi:hypothetical protein
MRSIKEQQLRLVFVTHEVSLRGHSLRRIETAMQRMELSFFGSVARQTSIRHPRRAAGGC